MRLIDAFVESLEAVLHVKRTLMSLKNVWSKAPPGGADSDMSEYLTRVCRTQIIRIRFLHCNRQAGFLSTTIRIKRSSVFELNMAKSLEGLHSYRRNCVGDGMC